MSIFQINNKKLKRVKDKNFDLEKDLQILTEENLEEVFGLQFISGKLNNQFYLHNFEIDTLAYDKDSRSFVIIEYKRDESFSVVDQGFNYLSLMLNNKAEFILEYNERLSADLKKSDVDWSQSRIIFIAPSFTPYQKGAISFKDIPIELWEITLYEDNLVLYNQIKIPESSESIKKITRSKTVSDVAKEVRTYSFEDHLSRGNNDMQSLLKNIRREIYEIDNRIIEKPVMSYLGYKIRYFNFCSIKVYKDKLLLHVQVNKIKDYKHLFKPNQRAANMTKLWYTELKEEKDIDYAIEIIRQSYEEAPDK